MQVLLFYCSGLLLSSFFAPLPLLWGCLTGLLIFISILIFSISYKANRDLSYLYESFILHVPIRRLAIICFFTAALTFGCFMEATATKQASSFPLKPGEEALVVGQVHNASVYRGEGHYRLVLAVKEVNNSPWQGQIFLYYDGGPLKAGEIIVARGEVMRFTPYGNPGAFNYDAYMKRQGLAASVSCYYNGEVKTLHGWETHDITIREKLLQAMDIATGDNSALLKGVFLGDKSDLSFTQKSTLSFAGVLHAFAVSGLHVGYVVAAALLLAGHGRRRRWQRLLLTICFLVFYLHLTGMPASIIRAAIMALTMQIAAVLDEKSDSWTTLALAALICLLYKPLWLFDAGFQLSFAAVGGLVYLLPTMRLLLLGHKKLPLTEQDEQNTMHKPFQRRLKQLKFTVFQALATTLAASFGIMPLIGYYFYNISLVGWLLSPLFVFGAGIIVLLCFTAALAAIFSVSLATMPLLVANVIMQPLMKLSSVCASLPGAYIASGKTPLLAVMIFFAAILILPYYLKQRLHPRLTLIFALTMLVILLSLAPAIARPMKNQLEVTYIDVGQGDATLIITPQGKSLLIDGGGSRMSSGQIGENVLIPFLRYRGIKKIDVMISTHPDADHIDGLLTVLENMQVKKLLYTDAFLDNPLQEKMLELANIQKSVLTAAYAGQQFYIEPEIILTVLNPPVNTYFHEQENNAGSLSILLSYKIISFIFTGDASFGDLDILPPAQIVKIPHHGSKNAYDEDAYAQLLANAVVISVGSNNTYGHPATSVIEYWQEHAAIFRTDINGAITIHSDGKNWQASTYW
ncbi:MAG: DNA internalization-related competence protein ComEC/Rec2 [Firmicutes bacterium]|nr:DNA internalization-related competence protein ComEC/Rec2 [Bacillota bacterium]